MIPNNANDIPIAPEQCVIGFGTTLIVAPHADDESLGCGGIISLLRKYDQKVYILLLSDGTLSHPNSQKYPAEKLMELREGELIEAAKILNVEAENIIFCRYPDREVPHEKSPNFETAVTGISKVLHVINPQSIFVPWRRDPHPDHRAAFQIIDACPTENAKIYEYPIWLQELGQLEDQPKPEEAMQFRVNIESVLNKKQDAILAHRSQTSTLIDDDPNGFTISKEMLSNFNIPYETFYISK